MKNFVVYKSGAGSGKTFTLVLEYLTLCLKDERNLNFQFKKILAITFTNKAAAEMKSRVIKALHDICRETPLPGIGAILQKQLGIGEAELKLRAAIVLKQILHNYADFSIGTIDSFTHRLVKTFAFDLKLPGNFNVEMDTAGFHNKVIALLLNKIGEDDYVSQLLKEFANHNAENNHAWDPEQQLQEFTNLLLQENAGDFIEQLNQFTREELDDFRKQFLDFIKHYETRVKQLGNEALQYIQHQHLGLEDFAYGKSGPVNFFQKCARAQVSGDDILGSRLISAVDNKRWFGKNSTKQDSSVEAWLSDKAKEIIDWVDTRHKAYLLCKLLARQMYALLLLKKIEEIARELKEEEHVVFLSEFNKKISDIIANEPTPFIYERLGEKYNHYLIDEFQDTSSLQWHNLIPLIDNSLAGGHRNLVVGDGKQSIYRWRNANVMQFAALPNIIGNHQNALLRQYQNNLSNNYDMRQLDTNYRSCVQIVQFNNAFFGFTAQKVLSEEFAGIYEGQQQRHKPNTDHENSGYVRFDMLHDKGADKTEFYLQKLLQHINETLAKGYRYEDMCVLVRKNYHGSLVAEALAAEGIPVVSSESLLLKNNREVNTLAAYLQYRIDPNDHISAAVILHYFFEANKISQENYHNALKDLSDKKSLSDILQSVGIAFQQESMALNNVFDTSLEAIRLLQIDSRASAYIRFFLDEVSNFLNQYNASVSKFLEWWEKRREKASLIIPKGSEAVQVMSIHASKGLEFPVVFIPFCDWSLNQSTDKWVHVSSEQTPLPVAVINLSQNASKAGFDKEVTRENQEQLLDNLNLLYVAFTRAVDKLFVYTAEPKNSQGNAYHWLMDYLQTQGHANADYFELGENSGKVTEAKEKHADDYVLNSLHFNPSPEAVKIKSSYLGPNAFKEAGERGLLLHHLLSNIHEAADMATCLDKAILGGLLPSHEKQLYADQLKQIVEHPQLAPYFESATKQYLEREIISTEGEILRPDKVVFEKDQTIVIDYKTGKKQLPAHRAQIINYAQVLSQMGYPAVKKLLVYLDTQEIVEVN